MKTKLLTQTLAVLAAACLGATAAAETDPMVFVPVPEKMLQDGAPDSDATVRVRLDRLGHRLTDEAFDRLPTPEDLPAMIRMLGSEPVTLLVAHEAGARDAHAEPVRLRAARTVIVENGHTLHHAEPVGVGTVISRGVLENPAPAPVTVWLMRDRELVRFTLGADQGFLVGDPRILSATGGNGATTGRKVCKCDCQQGNDVEEVEWECADCSNADCEKSNGDNCEQSDGDHGTLQSCSAWFIPRNFG